MCNQQKIIRKSQLTCLKAAVAAVCCCALSYAKTDVPLFLFSGQSNMVGLGATASTADQKKTVENIKIDCRADQNTKKWTTLGPGFGSSSSQFGPELFFGRTLADSMPGIKFAFIKDASSGTYLGKKEGWLPPSSGGPGTLYKNMMTHIDNAIKSFTTAFDTAQYTPRWAGFVWHQGEFDGMDNQLADKYETNLTNLIKDIRTKTGNDSLPVIIPMITGSNWQYKNIIQTAEITVAKKTVNADTMSTDGYALSDGVHYNAASMEKIGRICAQRWLTMKFTEGWWTTVPVVYRPTPAAQAVSGIHSSGEIFMFDITGRKIGIFSTGIAPRTFAPSALTIISESGSKSRTILRVTH
ncbi:MAG: hypothetical protein JXA18_02340 [Chitinispirillaceae bacterium]|nr:hypothetical protein [Chitinispirillaceae bacterium]